MQLFSTIITIPLATACLFAQAPAGSEAQASSDAQASKTRGMAARATPGDYQAHAAVGPLTIGAEFFQHTLPTPGGQLTSEDYVVVEAGIFGAPGARAVVNPADFQLRINEKKNPQTSEPYAMVFKSLKDPEWEAELPVGETKSKTSLGSSGAGGKSGGGEPPPLPPKPPFKLQREWNQRMQKAAFPEGDRDLPQAGLLFFKYGGKVSNIHTLELIYAGPAGKVSISLHP